ncbi:MAG: hypothetical protein V2B19_20890 [Pseudomonadota bacterium]
MSLYEDILNQTYGNRKAAGDLHELLWEQLLRREEPRFHNVRVTRGDGGIDGFVLRDPVLGSASVFQAKFYSDISSEEHCKNIVEAFARAHSHKFIVVDWCLLLPVTISHKELNWLIGGDLREKAKGLVAKERHQYIDACAISYQLESHLQNLCIRHLDVSAQFLPKSSLALIEKFEKERTRADFLQTEIADRLRIINQGLIRQRQIEFERAYNALRVLNQGWANHTGMLNLLMRDKIGPDKVEQFAAELEAFAERRIDQALIAEGLCSEIGRIVTNIYQAARRLRADAIHTQLNGDRAEQIWKQIKVLISDISNMQRIVGEVLANLPRGGLTGSP